MGGLLSLSHAPTSVHRAHSEQGVGSGGHAYLCPHLLDQQMWNSQSSYDEVPRLLAAILRQEGLSEMGLPLA